VAALTVAGLLITMLISACAWQPYVVTRVARHFTGVRTRLHVITPSAPGLASYRGIEILPVANLLAAHAPATVQRYLQARIAKMLGSLHRQRVVVAVSESLLTTTDLAVPAPTLVVEALLDDFDPGSLPLRLGEMGFNHIAVTVRVRLRDLQSGSPLGAISVTTQDDRASGTTSGAIDRVADRIGDWIAKGYAR
jgi:hypothetical protein